MKGWIRHIGAALIVALGPTTGSLCGQDATTPPPVNDAAPPDATPPPAPKPVPTEFNSPAATMKTFLEAMGDPKGVDLEQAKGCLDLEVPETARANARQLYGVINRLPEDWIRQLPSAEWIADPNKQDYGITEYVFFPREYDPNWDKRRGLDAGELKIALGVGDNGWWRFTAQTLGDIADLLDIVEELKPRAEVEEDWHLRLLKSLPGAKNHPVILKNWQWLGLFAVVLIGVITDFVFRFVLAIISRRIIARRGGEAASQTVRRTVRPIGLAMSALFWLFAIQHLELPGDALKVLLPAIRTFLMLAAVWTGFRVTDLISEVFQSRAARTETKFDDLLVPLIRKTLKIFIFVFGLIYIADSLDMKVTPLLAGLGIGGVGFAFAARDTLENFFGSLTVVVDRPFQVGDWVVIGDVEGTVEDVGFRSSRVRTFYNSLVTIPNGNLVRATVDNYGRRKYRRWKTHVSITYDTPPDKIEAFCEGIRELVRLHPYTRKDYYQVWLHQFAPSSLDVLVYVFHEAPDWTTELRERHRLMLDIIRLANHLGVEFAFPTETVHLYKEDHDAATPPPPAPGSGDDEKAMARGRQAVRAVTAAADWRAGRPGQYVFTQASEVDQDTQVEATTGGDG